MIIIKYTMKSRFITALALLGALLSPGFAAAKANGFGDLNITKGIEALEKSKDAQALGYFERYLGENPRGDLASQTRFLAARSALKLGAAHRALHYLQGLGQQLPQIPDYILSSQGQSHRALFEWPQAIERWQQLLKKYPQSPLASQTRYQIADAHFAKADLHKARELYRVAIGAAPRSEYAPLAKFNLAHIAELLGDWRGAATIYRQFAFYQPSHPLSDPAALKLEELVNKGKASPPSFGLKLTRIDKLLTRHSFDKAAAALKAIPKKSLSSNDLRGIEYRESQLLYRRGHYAEALKSFSGLADYYQEPHNLGYLKWMARTYSTIGEAKKAVAIYENLAETHKSNSRGQPFLFKAAWLAFNGGEHQEAIRLFGLFIERYPKANRASDATWYLGWNSYRLGDLPTAISTLEGLRIRYPRSSLVQTAHYWEGRIHGQIGNPTRALNSYRIASAINPYNYYGTWARQRLSEMNTDTVATAPNHRPPHLASLNWALKHIETIATDAVPSHLVEANSLEPGADELPEYGGMQPPSTVQLPWGGSVFNWSTPAGERALLLLRLGFSVEVSKLISTLEPNPGYSDTEISYARALLFHSLGDHHSGFKIASQAFRSILKSPLQPQSRPYFKMAYPHAHTQWLEHSTEEFNLSPLILLSVMRQESAFAPRARSWTSAAGLLQIIPSTGRKIAKALDMKAYNFRLLQNPKVNIRFGAWYLKELLKKFDSHIVLAVGSYNAGPKAVSRWLELRKDFSTDEFVEEIPYKQTRHYVRRVIGNLAVYQELYGGRPLRIPLDIPDNYLDNINF